MSPEFRPKAPRIEKENAHQSDDAIGKQLYAGVVAFRNVKPQTPSSSTTSPHAALPRYDTKSLRANVSTM